MRKIVVVSENVTGKRLKIAVLEEFSNFLLVCQHATRHVGMKAQIHV